MTTLSVVTRKAGVLQLGSTASAEYRGDTGIATALRRRTRARAAERTASTNTTADSYRKLFTSTAGFVMISTPPSSSASSALSEPGDASTEQTTTGIGVSAMDM